jgi:hypothetical protein
LRKARVALAGVVVGGLLLVGPAAAKAKQFHFQGGTDPFESNPPVGMTMVGKKSKHPKRLTEFSIEATFDCGSGPGTVLVRLPIERNKPAAKIRRNKKKDLTYFKWSYDGKDAGGRIVESYQLVGGQHRKHPKVWRGKVRIRLISEQASIEDACPMVGADEDGYVHWEAKLCENCFPFDFKATPPRP